MLRDELKRRVKMALEELSAWDEPRGFLAVPNNEVKPIDSYIEGTLDASFDDVLLSVPLSLIRETFVDYRAAIKVDSEGVGYMFAPLDMLRLHTVRFPEWRRDVKGYVSELSGEFYRMQRNPYTRGRFEKPVVALNNGVFELYSLRGVPQEGSYVFRYVPRTVKQTPGFEDGLSDYLVLQNAIHVLEVFEQTDKVKLLRDELVNKLKAVMI